MKSRVPKKLREASVKTPVKIPFLKVYIALTTPSIRAQ